MEHGENGGLEQPGSSDVGQSLALRKMIEELGSMELKEVELLVLKILECPLMLTMLEPLMLKILERPLVLKKLELMVLKFVGQVVPSATEGLFRNVVREEIQKFLPGGSRNYVPKERSLELKFLDEVSGPVQTSKKFKGIKDGPLKVALFDATGHIVNSGLESSAEVEILLSDEENNTTNESSERRIIRAGDKMRPHFAKNVHINLENGVANLNNLKLGQDSNWTKPWTCSLGARIVTKFRGITVQEGWTAPFKVIDNRGEIYKNEELPCLSSNVWRLKKIGRGGKPRERLEGRKIMTVQDLLFWLSVNPEELQKILGAGDNRWKTIVDHAQTCNIDDKRMFFHKPSSEPQMGVIYDVVGELKGVIDESHFVPIDNLSVNKKDHARNLLSSVLEPSAFVERYKIFFNDEDSLLQQYPYKSFDPNASKNSIQQFPNANDLTQAISPNNNFESLGPIDGGASCHFPDPQNINGEYLDYERPCFSTSSTFLEILEADPREMLAPASKNWENVNPLTDMNQSTGLSTHMDSLQPNCPGAGTSEVVVESRSRRFNTSFHSASSTMYSFGESVGYDEYGVMHDAMPNHHWFPPPLSSPDRMQYDLQEYYSHTQMSNADDDQNAAASVVNTPNWWKQLFYVLTWRFSISRRVSRNVIQRERKKPRVG